MLYIYIRYIQVLEYITLTPVTLQQNMSSARRYISMWQIRIIYFSTNTVTRYVFLISNFLSVSAETKDEWKDWENIGKADSVYFRYRPVLRLATQSTSSSAPPRQYVSEIHPETQSYHHAYGKKVSICFRSQKKQQNIEVNFICIT